MRIFEHPVVGISVIVVCCFLLGGIVMYYAVRSLKRVNDGEDARFTNINKLESSFAKFGRLRENRSVLFISVFLDDYRGLYSHEKTEAVYNAIKRILLQVFSSASNGMVSAYGDGAYIAFSTLEQNDTKALVQSFYDTLNKRLVINHALNVIDVTIGIFPALGTDISFDDAINRAQKACILAKNAKMPYAEWNANSGKALDKKIKIENNIENEIDNNRFFLVYQPVLDAKTKEIIGAEVLSRLNSATDGIMQPGHFLSAVDSVGLNNKFDYYIFEKNCIWISADKKQREGYKYTINFSRSTLCEPEFAEKILNIADKYHLNASCLAVEILEDKHLSNEAKAQMMENLTTLKEKGVSILLDDFGSGYATLGDLQNLDISIVKIDSAITQNSVTENGYIILENIIRMAKSIGYKTLCEGVETQEQEEAVIRAGCDLLQGFYYYKPMPAVMLESLLGKEEPDSETI